MRFRLTVLELPAVHRETAAGVLRAGGLSEERIEGILTGATGHVADQAEARRIGDALRSLGVRIAEWPEDPVDYDAAFAKHRAGVLDACTRSLDREHAAIDALWQAPEGQLAAIDGRVADERARLHAAREALDAALAPRRISAKDVPYGQPPALTLDQWIRGAAEVASSAGARRIPFFEVKRLEDMKAFIEKAAPLYRGYDAVVADIEERADQERTAVGAQAFSSWVERTKKELLEGDLNLTAVADPAPSAPMSSVPGWAGGDLPAVADPLAQGSVVPRVRAGEVAFSSSVAVMTSRAPDRAGTLHTQKLAFTQNDELFRFPVEVDLDAQGGLVTDSTDVVESAVLQLLDTIPAGMLRIDAVDPVRLGESLSFLYGLNDAGDKVLGDAVWTTAEQTSRLLERLEAHITFVTQKYLQGQHRSLTSYNLAAGEVAEPYRAVLLYDFPRMFTRDGRTDDAEALTRLEKLVSAGRRCGVYFFVTEPSGSPHRALGDLRRVYRDQAEGVPTTGVDVGRIGEVTLGWVVLPAAAPPVAERERIVTKVLRGLQTQTEAQVLPETVAALTDRRNDQDAARGLDVRVGTARADDASTWWRRSSAGDVTARFGRMGASGVAELEFNSAMESSALIGGQTGSGKSYLFHAIIMDLVLNYGPDELELYLIDLKEGVEFTQYARERLPHARAIAIESNREFAVSVLRDLDAEIRRRGQIFKDQPGTTVDLAALRGRTGEVLPRVVVMIDEFHKLFAQEDAIRRDAEQLLERIIKEGRAFGVHIVLGSQSIALVGSAFRSIADQIYHRLVLASSDADSRLLLGEGNPDAQLLSRPGEGIQNSNGGLREANGRFQASFWAADRRSAVLRALRDRGDEAGFADREPLVFEGSAAVPVQSIPASLFGRSDPHRSLELLIGAPMSLQGPFSATLERAPGRNVLIVDDRGWELAVTMAVDLARASVSTSFVDFGVFDVDTEDVRDALGGIVDVARARQLTGLLDELVAEIDRRIAVNEYSAPARVLVLAGIQRARDLTDDPYAAPEDSPSPQLARILKDGPEVGVFTVAVADRPASVERRLTSSMLREFGVKVVGTMGADDSRRFVDTDDASRLKASEVYFDDMDRVVTRVLRRFEVGTADWVRESSLVSDARG